MLVIGLTGGIGSGKSTVARIFAEHHIPIIDTDLIARQLVTPDQPAFMEITQYFGNTILNSNGELDRKRLAAITFKNPEARNQLEQILHPRIRQAVEKQLATIQTDYVVIVVPLLAEKGKYPFIDRVIVVDCDESDQIARTIARDQRSREQIEAIMQSQASRQQRLKIADDIIHNTGDPDMLRHSVTELHHFYMNLCKT
ncbi:MAG: dephospho-CoA kinase [Gammaproteobacteria bacterium]|nr:MAG: dephospho-CoA kinase [Gammaproteobacteria bacterium]